MSVYMTEEEQLESIKKWWTRYGNSITVILSLLLLGVAGFKYWAWHQDKIKMQASTAYEHLMLAFSNQDTQAVQAYATQLVNDYGQTVYADAARLTLAKVFVASENYDKAEKELEYVANRSKIRPLKQIAAIRIARIFAAEKAYDKALTQLSTIEDSVYLPVVNELKGDIYAAKGQYQQALLSYKEAMSQVHTHGMANLFLEMKTSELAASTQSTKAENSAPQAA